MKKIILIMFIMFITGWCFNSAYSAFIEDNQTIINDTNENTYEDTDEDTYEDTDEDIYKDTNKDTYEEPIDLPLINFGEVLKKESKIAPYDHITEDKIHVYNDRIVIFLENPEWSKFTDTNSMLPILDIGSNAVRIKPRSIEDIHVGDIISYKSKYASGIIIHRVIEIDEDNDGWYCKVKGDNNPFNDPGKIRFEQILGINVMIIW